MILYLFGTPSFIYDNVRFTDVYAVVNWIDQISTTHHTKLSGEYTYLGSYPGAIFFFSFSHIISGVPALIFAKYYPIYLMFLLSILIYCIAKRISYNYAFLAPLSLLSIAWMQEYHLAPQSVGLILYTTLFLVLFKQSGDQKKQTNISLKIIGITALIAIIISHPGTPIFIILNLSFLYIVFISTKYLSKLDLKLDILSTFLILIVVIWLSWLLYISSGYFQEFVNGAQRALNSAIQNPASAVINPGLLNPQRDVLLINWLRKGIIIVEIILGLLCVVFLWLKKSKELSLIIGGWFISCLFFHFYSMYHSAAFFGRVLVFSLISFSVLICFSVFKANYMQNHIQRTNKKQRITTIFQVCLILFLLSSAFLIPITRYCGDSSEYRPDSGFAAHRFMSNHNIGNVARFDSCTYNFYQTKQQRGEEYKNSFNSVELSKIYDSGESKIYKNWRLES